MLRLPSRRRRDGSVWRLRGRRELGAAIGASADGARTARCSCSTRWTSRHRRDGSVGVSWCRATRAVVLRLPAVWRFQRSGSVGDSQRRGTAALVRVVREGMWRRRRRGSAFSVNWRAGRAMHVASRGSRVPRAGSETVAARPRSFERSRRCRAVARSESGFSRGVAALGWAACSRRWRPAICRTTTLSRGPRDAAEILGMSQSMRWLKAVGGVAEHRVDGWCARRGVAALVR